MAVDHVLDDPTFLRPKAIAAIALLVILGDELGQLRRVAGCCNPSLYRSAAGFIRIPEKPRSL
jgi:hypothetical protein